MGWQFLFQDLSIMVFPLTIKQLLNFLLFLYTDELLLCKTYGDLLIDFINSIDIQQTLSTKPSDLHWVCDREQDGGSSYKTLTV